MDLETITSVFILLLINFFYLHTKEVQLILEFLGQGQACVNNQDVSWIGETGEETCSQLTAFMAYLAKFKKLFNSDFY